MTKEANTAAYALRILVVAVNLAVQIIPLWLMYVTQSGWPALIITGFFFGIVPILELVIGERTPEIRNAGNDSFFVALLYIQALFHFAIFAGVVALVCTVDLPLWASAMAVLSIGVLNGQCPLIAHEFGHKAGRIKRLSSNMVLAIVGMGHFMVQHVRGHHVQVATPEDCASAPMGQDAYTFVLGSFPKEVRGGITLEAERLAKRGIPAWSIENDVIQSYSLALLIAGAFAAVFGLKVIPWIILHHFGAWFSLMLTTYIQHYGLMRAMLPNGRREPVTVMHSWNTDSAITNLILFNVQRHSDHHARPMVPYQSLHDIKSTPRLPTGYFGMMILALIPPLWFRVMDPRVLEVMHGDRTRINMKRGQLAAD